MTRLKAALLLNLLIIMIYVFLEAMWPARKIHYRKVLLRDLGSVLLTYILSYGVVFIIVLLSWHKLQHSIYNWFHQKPFYIQLICFILCLDFSFYWTHRFMHVKWMWRTHRWHHLPTEMYFVAGVRSSFIHQFLLTICFLLCFPILQTVKPLWFFIFSKIQYYLFNNFLHMNVVWNSRYLEWFLVTPRFHHVHHSANYGEHHGNFGSLLTIWDRLFGSYINPDHVSNIQFGTGEKTKHPFQFLGL